MTQRVRSQALLEEGVTQIRMRVRILRLQSKRRLQMRDGLIAAALPQQQLAKVFVADREIRLQCQRSFVARDGRTELAPPLLRPGEHEMRERVVGSFPD